MACIKEPIACGDVQWSGSGIWCSCQGFWTKAGILICAAHMEEGRIFTCGFTGPGDENLKHCRDYWANQL